MAVGSITSNPLFLSLGNAPDVSSLGASNNPIENTTPDAKNNTRDFDSVLRTTETPEPQNARPAPAPRDNDAVPESYATARGTRVPTSLPDAKDAPSTRSVPQDVPSKRDDLNEAVRSLSSAELMSMLSGLSAAKAAGTMGTATGAQNIALANPSATLSPELALVSQLNQMDADGDKSSDVVNVIPFPSAMAALNPTGITAQDTVKMDALEKTPVNPAAIAAFKEPQSTKEWITPLSDRLAELNAFKRVTPFGRFSKVQGGLGQVDMESELSEIKAIKELKAEPMLNQIAQLVETRTGTKAEEVRDLLVQSIFQRTNETQEGQLKNALERAQLEIDFKQGVLRDLAATADNKPATQPGSMQDLLLMTDLQAALEQEMQRRGEMDEGHGQLTMGPRPHDAVKATPTSSTATKAVSVQPDVPTQFSDSNMGSSSFKSSAHEMMNEAVAPESLGQANSYQAAHAVAQHLSANSAEALGSKIGQAGIGATGGLANHEVFASGVNKDAIITSVQSMVHQGGGEMVVNLRPVELGHVRISVVQIGREVTIAAQAERADVADRLRQDMPHILSGLEDRGVNVARMDVGILGGSTLSTIESPRSESFSSRQFNSDGRSDEFLRQQQQSQANREQNQRQREKFYDLMDLVA